MSGDGALVAPAAPLHVRPLDAPLVPMVVDVHMKAFEGFLSGRLGRRYATSFLNWFRTSRTGVALVAVSEDGFVHGYLVGARSDYSRTMLRRLLFAAAIGIAARPWLLADASLLRGLRVRLASLMRPDSGAKQSSTPATMDLVAIGVAPGSRGHRVGERLVEDFERRALALGMRSVRLSVKVDNTPARRLYERRDWRVVPGSLDPMGTSLVYAKSLV
jgi:ribosomal protein S18 acetylase RimI-like enzyme